ncbi:hypothetical protein [Methanogenium organophilum]|uniref:Uncharacterized protein n=1 Tax=Methanogenium organophilum TaxID=2199 RepID=A0A9X9T6N7_METOG|nr:hypothetical protein [Methanogenium organophilum]WAI00548.1 hypothetical protein OU421_08910 [Methanogenium organophilum]
MTFSKGICDLECEDLLILLREFGYSIESKNERYITLKSEWYLLDYICQTITLPNCEIIPGPIIESALKQGNISRHSFIEKIKGIATISSEESIVAHVDILGFKSLIQEAQKDSAKFDEILNQYNRALKNAFNQVQSTTKRNHSLNLIKISHVRVYTDNLLFVNELETHGYGESDFGETLGEIAQYQFSLALEGYFTRGVIFVERSYADEILVFSPVLLHAEEYEKKAVYPRVILNESAIARVSHYFPWYGGPEHSPFYDILLVDQDGQWFINYLYILYYFNEDMVQMQIRIDGGSPASQNSYYPEAITLLHQHRDHISANLDKFKDDAGTYRKYQWLAEYHNHCCKRYFPNDSSAQIEGFEGSFSTLSSSSLK